METVACNLCDCAEYQHFATVPDLFLDRKEITATLVQCAECGLVYQNPRPIMAEMGQHYPSEYEPYIDATSDSGRNWLLQRAVNYGIDKHCRFVTRHKSGGTVLDLGCATGTFLQRMQRQPGWETVGVELSDEAAAIARSRHNLNVFSGTLEEAQFADEQFDAVTLWQVLEHLHNPAASLGEIHRILKPGGIVVIRVPNLASWDARIFGNVWAGLDSPRHLYVFTPDTLSSLLEKQGFSVLSHSCAVGGYVTFALSVRYWMTANETDPLRQAQVRRVLYHPAARLATAPLFYVPAVLRRGTMLVTTAQKTIA